MIFSRFAFAFWAVVMGRTVPSWRIVVEQEIAAMSRFESFLDVQKEFRYHMCVPGTEMIESFLLAIPKFMTVVSRTDLTLEQPARDGILQYHRGRVRNRIEKIFS